MRKRKSGYLVLLTILLCILCACEKDDDSNGRKRQKNDEVVTETPTPTMEAEPISPTSPIATPTEAVVPTVSPLPTQAIPKEDMLSTRIRKACERSTIPEVVYDGEESFEELAEKGICTEDECKAWTYASDSEVIKSFLELYYGGSGADAKLFGYDYNRDILRKIVDSQEHYLVGATIDRYNQDQRVWFCCISFKDSLGAEEIYNTIVEECFEKPGEGSGEMARIPWTRYFHNNDGAKAITCDTDSGLTWFVCTKGNEIVLSESIGKTLFVNEICSACDMPSPYGKDGGDKRECDAKKVVQLLYYDLFPWGSFSESAFNLIYPEDIVQRATSKAQTKADVWDYGFNLLDFSKDQYDDFLYEYSCAKYVMYPYVVVCEDAYNPEKTNQLLNGDNKPGSEAYHDYTLSEDWFFGDDGASVYVAVVEWGYMLGDFDDTAFRKENNRDPNYDELDVHGLDVVWVYRYNGRWYVAGKPFGFETYAVEMK